jgi:hypothetical protein
MSASQARLAGWTAVAIGVVTFLGIACLILFYARVADLAGTLNDLANAAEGVLSAALALTLRSAVGGQSPAVRSLPVLAAVAGAVIAVIGTWLVAQTGFYYAALVSSVGLGLVGLWVIALNRGFQARTEWPRRLNRLGLAAGVIMAVGLVAGLGLPGGVHSMSSAAWYEWIGLCGWIGTYVLYPIWSIWFGRSLLRTDAPSERRAVTA